MEQEQDIYSPPAADMEKNSCPYCSNPGQKLRKKSKLAVFSFASALTSQIGLILLILFAAIDSTRNLKSPGTEVSPETMGFIAIILIVFSLIAFVTGLISILKKHLNKIYAILGLVFSMQIITLIIVGLIIGMYASGIFNR